MDLLKEEIMKSNSNELVQNISKTMFGKTFHHHYHILYDIRTLLGNEKKIYTEIGTFCGGSASLMMSHNYETVLHCIDPLHVISNQYDIVKNNIVRFNKNNYEVNVYKKFSNDKNFIEELINSNFTTDILFIDGDHSYNGVINDFNNFEQFVNKKGYIVFDDYNDYMYSPEVKIAVDDIVKKIDTEKYEVLGTMENIKNSHDILNLKLLNEFILYKK